MDPAQDEFGSQNQLMDQIEIAKRKEETATAMKESLKKWKSEREKNEEYIKQMKMLKEERKKAIEAEQSMLLAMKEEEEEEAARAEDDAMIIETTSEETKKETLEENKQNFADQKKFKTKEEREYYEALAHLIKPFDVKSMDSDQLKKKVAELYDIFTNIINDKINLNKRLVEQDTILKELREKLSETLDAKAAKKGSIDMHKFYPGKKVHPPKMTIFSKYDNRKGARTYDDRKEMYDVGTDVVRPQMLVSVWEEKFNAWMNSEPAALSDQE